MAVVIDGMLVNYGIFIKRFIHIKKVFIYQFHRIYYNWNTYNCLFKKYSTKLN